MAHTGWTASDHVRGGSAFGAAISTELKVDADKIARTATLKDTKQREREVGHVNHYLAAHPIGDSMVLIPDQNAVYGSGGVLNKSRKDKLRILCVEESLTMTAWANAAGVAPNSFKASATALSDAGYVVQSMGAYVATNAGRGARGLPLGDDDDERPK